MTKKAVENRNKFLDRYSNPDNQGNSNFFKEIREGAEAERAARAKLYEERDAKQRELEQAKRDKFQDLINKTGKKIHEKNKAKYEQEVSEAVAQSEAELKRTIALKHGTKSDEELAREKAYRKMLGGSTDEE